MLHIDGCMQAIDFEWCHFMKTSLSTVFFLTAFHSFAIDIDIDCPDVQECFECWTKKVANDKIQFTFTRTSTPGRNWSPIVMVAATSTPIANIEKATPELDLILPIQLGKDSNGDWVVVCKYSESSKYGGHVGYTPVTTLTIDKNEVQKCFVKNAKIVTCSK